MKFSYRLYSTIPSPATPTGILHRPEIAIRIAGAAGTSLTWATVDPGSDDTVIPLSIARAVGAKIDATSSWMIAGIGAHPVAVILGEIEFRLTDGKQRFHWYAKVGVVDFGKPEDEVTILGHANFLDYFRVTFDGQQRMLEIEVTPAFPGQVI